MQVIYVYREAGKSGGFWERNARDLGFELTLGGMTEIHQDWSRPESRLGSIRYSLGYATVT